MTTTTTVESKKAKTQAVATRKPAGRPSLKKAVQEAAKPSNDKPAVPPPAKVALIKSLDSQRIRSILVSWDMIERHPANYRKHFDEADIAGLWQSISTIGLTDALMVRPHPTKKGKYQLVDGERRHRAIEYGGPNQQAYREVKVEIYDLTDVQVRAVMAVTRAQSRDLLLSELAACYADLLKDHGTTERVAELVGQKPRKVQDILRIMKLPDFARQAIDEGRIKPGTMARVARIPGKENRVIAATYILAGRHYYHASDKLPKIQPDDEPLSDRAVVEFIHAYFQKDLGDASFDWKKPLPMFKEQPDCQSCPKRAGNDPEAKEDGVRADMCLDLECFERKSQCYSDGRLAEAKQSGQTVMSATEAKKVLSDYGECTPNYGSGYLDLNHASYETNHKKPRDVIKDLDPKDVVLAKDKNGQVHELVKRKDVTIPKPKSEGSGGKRYVPSEAEKKAAEKLKEEKALESAIEKATLNAVNEAGRNKLFKEVGQAGIEMLRLVCHALLESGDGGGLFDRRGWEDGGAFKKLGEEIDLAGSIELGGLVAELLYDFLYMDKEKQEVLDVLGIDGKAIEKKVKEDAKKPALAITKAVGKLHLSKIEGFPWPGKLIPAKAPLCATPPFDTLGEVIELAEKQTAMADHGGKLRLALSTKFVDPKEAERGAEAILNHLYPGRKGGVSAHPSSIEKGKAHLNGEAPKEGK